MEYTYLKIQLMQNGAVFTENARRHMPRGKFGHVSFLDYATTGGVVLEIGNTFYANVPVRFDSTPFCIDREKNKFVLKKEDRVLPLSVNIRPVPQYALDNVRLEDGTPVRELVMTHADRLRISPIHGCNFHCQFCTCNNQKYREVPVESLDQAVQVALADPNNRPRHILISGGTAREKEDSYEYLNKVFRFFPHKYVDYEFDIMLSPRGRYAGQNGKNAYEDFLKYLHEDCGIATMSVNLELYNESLRKKYIPEKYAIGKEQYLLFIRKAVDVFGEGKIRSSLVVGLEDKEDTLAGVRELAACGCIPVLSAFVPAQGTFMERYPKPEVDFLLEVVHEAAEIARHNHTILGPLCRPCTHNSLTEEAGSIELPGDDG